MAFAGGMAAGALVAASPVGANAPVPTAGWRLGPAFMRSAARGWISLLPASLQEGPNTFAFTTDGGHLWRRLPSIPGFPAAWLAQGDALWVVSAPAPGRAGRVRILQTDMASDSWRTVATLSISAPPAPDIAQWRLWQVGRQVGVARLVFASELPGQRPVKVSA